MKTEPRLHFTKEELETEELKKPIKKVQKAAKKADKKDAKVPKKKVREFVYDDTTGKYIKQVKLQDKKMPSSGITKAIRKTPETAVSSSFHKNISEYEDDNTAVKSFHKSEEAIEALGKTANSVRNSYQIHHYSSAQRAENKLKKANLNVLYKKAELDNPSSNPLSHIKQKQEIKRQYAKAKSGRRTEGFTYRTKKAYEAVFSRKKRAERQAVREVMYKAKCRKIIGIVIGIIMGIMMIFNCLSSCSVLINGAGSAIAGSTYPSQDEDMLGAEAAYCELEDNLQSYLDNYESEHSYDEYHFELDEIKHDPYVLISILTVLHQGEWKLDEVKDTIKMLFDKQYILTENVTKKVKHRTETRTDSEGNQYEEDVSYNYYVCTVTLENFDLTHVPVYIMDEDQLGGYAAYMATLGNRPDLFTDSEYIDLYINKDVHDYGVAPEALLDATFAAMITEAEKYLGYPYVWGGASPKTSFDCSGFVSWVVNHSGWNLGRQTAQGLCNLCTPVSAADAKPGDLVFFKGTYKTNGVSHVGIFVGNDMMIHAGDPIKYAKLNTNYWQSHIFQYGRLPEP